MNSKTKKSFPIFFNDIINLITQYIPLVRKDSWKRAVENLTT